MEKMITKIETLENDLAEVTEKLEKEVLKTKELSETLLESRSNNIKKDTQIANIRQENHEMLREVDRLSGMVKVYKRWKGVIPKEKLPSPKVIAKIYEEDWTDK
jgi:predicted nuclease with TOPRIM domain